MPARRRNNDEAVAQTQVLVGRMQKKARQTLAPPAVERVARKTRKTRGTPADPFPGVPVGGYKKGTQ